MRECPGGHELTRWRNRIATLSCDGACSRKLKEGDFRWSCNLCDFDICETCVAPEIVCKPVRSTTPLVPVPTRAASNPGPTLQSCRPPAPRTKKITEGTPVAGAAFTPALTTGVAGINTASLVEGSSGLESIKRDLTDLTDSARPAKRTARQPLSRVSSGEDAALQFLLAGASAQLPRLGRRRRPCSG